MSSISTLTMNTTMLATIAKAKKQASDAMTESQSGRYVDVGLTLGRLTGTSVGYRVQSTSLDAQLDTNKVIAARLDQAYTIMGGVNDTGSSISSSLLSAEKATSYPEIAKSALESMMGNLNQSVGDTYIFAGDAADKAPMKDTDTALANAKAYFNDFLTAMGPAGTPAKASDLKPEVLTAFLSSGGYTINDASASGNGKTYSFLSTVDLQDAPTASKTIEVGKTWADSWSQASSAETQAKISKSESVQTSVSANGTPFKQMTAAYSMLAAIGGEAVTDDTKKALTQAASKLLATGMAGITDIRAVVGTRQNRVEAADTALNSEKDVVDQAFSDLEGVDQTEAYQRYLALETQLNGAYTITGRLQKLSILNYL